MTTQTTTIDPVNAEQPVEYPGLARLPYFGLSVLFGFVAIALLMAMGVENAGGWLMLNVISVIVSLWLGGLRMSNLGSHPAWVLLLLVPIINIAVSIYLMCYPTGYAQHRTLDGTAKVLLGLVAALFVLPIVAIFAVS